MLRNIVIFFKYLFRLIKGWLDVTEPNDVALSLGLYLAYPAILFLLIDKFHGLCGKEHYLKKLEAILACKSLYLWFTTLLRTYKLFIIMLYSVDAAEKDGSRRHLETEPRSSGTTNEDSAGSGEGFLGGMLKKLKCQTWMHLSQELATVGFVAFLLLVCLPVLAFWFMFISILVSSYNIIMLVRRMWNESQDDVFNIDTYDASDAAAEGDVSDLEFQEFLSNFGDESS